METVTFQTVVNIADADGKAIREGSVLRHIEDACTGVVVRVFRKGDRSVTGFEAVGDVAIRVSAGHQRITNSYSKWRHLPHNDQTYEQRYLSWLHTKGSEDFFSETLSKDEQKAITGILALLPDDLIDWSYGDTPTCMEDALRILAVHLSNTKLTS